MKKELVEIYSDASNNVVLRHPGRRYPGSLIQGDSLGILISEIKEAKAELRSGNIESTGEILSMIEERLTNRLEVYNKAINGHEFV